MNHVCMHSRTNDHAQALTIAGSDSGGGAGIQADLKTFIMRDVFGTSVLTATTAQNTQGVWDIHHLPTAHVYAQLVAIRDDFKIGACKIGMLGTSDVIDTVGQFLQNRPFGQVVLDPVMIAKGGQSLLDDNAKNSLRRLIPLTDVITPNLPEAHVLTGLTMVSDDDIIQARHALQEMGGKTVIIKGGHSQNSQSAVCTDWVMDEMGKVWHVQSPRSDNKNTHGTGCTFSACITAELAKGVSVAEAIHTAKGLIDQAISTAPNIGHGHGAVNHWAFWEGKRWE